MGEKPTAAEDETSRASNLNLSKSNINKKPAPGGGKAGGVEESGEGMAAVRPAEF